MIECHGREIVLSDSFLNKKVRKLALGTGVPQASLHIVL